MHHHTHLFWLAGVIVAAMALLLLVRLGFKRRSFSRAQKAKLAAGVPLSEVASQDVKLPQE